MPTTFEYLFILIIFVFLIVVFVAFHLGLRLGFLKSERIWKEKIPYLKQEIANSQRANIKGKVAETFAPLLNNFPFKPSECRFIGNPIDYVVFEGLDENNIKAIRFVEVKSDLSKLTKQQKQIKEILDSIKNEKIGFQEFNLKTKEDNF